MLDSHNDLNFKSKSYTKSSKCLWEIKYNQHVLYVSDKAYIDVFENPFFNFIFEHGKVRTILYFPGNISYISASRCEYVQQYVTWYQKKT